MAIDITTETLITPREYARMRPVGRNGRPMALSTVYRHFHVGVGGRKLETVKFGGQIYTSVEAVRRFLDHLTEGRPSGAESPLPPTLPAASRTSDRRGKDADRDAEALDRLRI
jgi:hypothetical protein